MKIIKSKAVSQRRMVIFLFISDKNRYFSKIQGKKQYK